MLGARGLSLDSSISPEIVTVPDKRGYSLATLDEASILSTSFFSFAFLSFRFVRSSFTFFLYLIPPSLNSFSSSCSLSLFCCCFFAFVLRPVVFYPKLRILTHTHIECALLRPARLQSFWCVFPLSQRIFVCLSYGLGVSFPK